MGFTDTQKKNLSAKLAAKHVKTRKEGEKTLSYLEGWHVLAEANRIFGFDSWDRETFDVRCVWEGTANRQNFCSYIARVRIKVHAEQSIVVREGCGAGNGSGVTPGDAHELAIKQAETDATKRALATFGNVFGLALYDKDRKGVRGSRKTTSLRERPATWSLLDASGRPISEFDDPVAYCSALRERLEAAADADALISFWKRNQETVAKLRTLLPGLKTEKGQYYGEILSALYTKRLQSFAAEHQTSTVGHSAARPKNETDNTENRNRIQRTPKKPCKPSQKRTTGGPLSKGPLRRRDKAHLKFVASKSCLVCGRLPSQAHHLRIAQPRATGRKPSDEFTVPLCAIHHRALHDAGDEQRWWVQFPIDPLKEARRLWDLYNNGERTA